MTEDKKAEVIALANELFVAQERIRAMSMRNTPFDPEERRKQLVDFYVAKAEEYEALAKMNAAIDPTTPTLMG